MQCPLLIHKRSPEMFVRSAILIHLTLSARPLLVTQLELLDLAGGRLWQLSEFHRFGGLETSKVFFAMIYDVVFCKGLSRF